MHAIEAISNLTLLEQTHLRATLHIIDNDNFKCWKCPERAREAKRCVKPVDGPPFIELESDLKFKKCPGNYFSQSALQWLEMFNAFEKGTMPFNGSYSEQPNKIIDIFRVISTYRAKRTDGLRMKAAFERMKGGRK